MGKPETRKALSSFVDVLSFISYHIYARDVRTLSYIQRYYHQSPFLLHSFNLHWFRFPLYTLNFVDQSPLA